MLGTDIQREIYSPLIVSVREATSETMWVGETDLICSRSLNPHVTAMLLMSALLAVEMSTVESPMR